MTLAGPWLLSAMSEGGQPSARRVVMLAALLVFAPALLVGIMRWAPAVIAECFLGYIAICGGVYVGGSLASRGQAPPPPPVTP